jgi:S1-C subfamily serine protease
MDDELTPLAEPRQGLSLLRVLAVVALLLSVVILAAPLVAARIWMARAQVEADTAYLRRQAELRAEADAADERLRVLDGRFQLVALGFREVARKVRPCVVHVANEVEADEPGPFRQFHDPETNQTFREQAEGSGILVEGGRVLTNHHVVAGAGRVRVSFASGQWIVVPGEDVRSDPLTDLAVIVLPAPESASQRGDQAAHVTFADSERDVEVGDWVLAVGSPFGLRQTVTAGVLSAKGRVELGILDQVELLQTDAAINPGNSGGPLFDQFGRLVGINVAIASKTGVNQGVGFAIPSNTARDVLQQLTEHGEVVRGFLGIGMQELSPDMERRLRVADTGGVLVSHVLDDSPAHRAGFQLGDVVTHFQGQPLGPVNALNQLRLRIARTVPDTEVRIGIVRRGKPLILDATIVKRPAALPR